MNLTAKRAELQATLDRAAGAIAIVDEMLAEQAAQDAADAEPPEWKPTYEGIDPNPYWNNYVNETPLPAAPAGNPGPMAPPPPHVMQPVVKFLACTHCSDSAYCESKGNCGHSL